jgi:uracil-DNA glycosylase
VGLEPARELAKGSRCKTGAAPATVTGNEATSPLGDEPGKALRRMIRESGNLAVSRVSAQF